MDADRLINIKEVQHIVGLKHAMIYAMVNKNTFPKPIKIGRAARWSPNVVQNWVAETVNNGGAK
ncbi:AlpA family phage regulatory protein [Ochrobactrum sp. A-1]|uniref:AlpA family phage regulatory protein n=1 Tax=Ochrobactrum sp. A-1 TaxID=2920940 RepID=UPI001F0AC808|nr:AlpA family phage regulatory protein [Ochrobactrum sp. A-1]